MKKVGVSLEPALKLVILLLACSAAVLVRVFSVIRYESIIHEFDPWFNFRTTKYLTANGLNQFWNYFDSESWFPLGRDVGASVYPGMMLTAAFVHKLLWVLGLPLDIREVCVFLGPAISAITCYFTYLLTRQVSEREGAGLFSAVLMSVATSYMSRSVAGSFDNECVAICAIVVTFYLFLRACNTGSVLWSLLSSLAFFYLVAAWGGYSFVINIIPLFILFLLFFGYYSPKIYIAYSVFYVFSTVFAMQIKFVQLLAIASSDHMLSHGAFFILQTFFVFNALSKDRRENLARIMPVALVVGFLIIFAILQFSGLTRWTGRTLTLLNPTYAKNYIPIVASVAEHRATDFSYFMSAFGNLNFLVPAGLYVIFTRKRLTLFFIGIFIMCAVYFSSIMVRLLLMLCPAVIVAASIGANWLVERAFTALRPGSKVSYLQMVLVPLGVVLLGAGFIYPSINTGAVGLSSPSIVLESHYRGERFIVDDFREAYYWLRVNTPPDAVVMSWWDYGYQITGLSNRTTIADGNTWNNTHIATIGLAMASPEDQALEVVNRLGADYVLVIFGGRSGYSGDDINKFYWMVSIGGGVYPHIKLEKYFGDYGPNIHPSTITKEMKESLMYKASYYRHWEGERGQERGYDGVRRSPIGHMDYKLQKFEESFTSELWIVRIYKKKKEGVRSAISRRDLLQEEAKGPEQASLGADYKYANKER